MLAAPRRQVVERLLGPDRSAVEAKQESLRRWIPLAPHQSVVERGEQGLAGGCERDDRLHRGVVLGSRVKELPRALEEPRRREILGTILLPPFDRLLVARARVFAPAIADAPLSAIQQDAEGRGTPHGDTPHGR